MDNQSKMSEEYSQKVNNEWKIDELLDLPDEELCSYEEDTEISDDNNESTKSVKEVREEENCKVEEPTVVKKLDPTLFLTALEIQKCTDAFDKYKDPEMKLLRIDFLGPAMRQIGLTPNKKQIEQYREIVDYNALGVLGLDSFIEIACHFKINKEKSISLEDVDAAFQVLAQDGANLETFQFLGMIATTGEPFSIDELISFRNYVDPKRSGLFDYKLLISRFVKMDEVKVPKKKKKKNKGRKARK